MSDRVRAWWAAGSVAFAAAFLLAGYEFVRGASNTLFKEAYGRENLPKVMAVMPLAVLAVLWVYGRTLSALGPRRTLLVTTLGSGVLLAGAAALYGAGWRAGAVLLYLSREAYIVLILEQYWSFLNSTFGQRQARRLNGPVCGVASLGAIAGGLLVQRWALPFGTLAMPLIGAATLLPAAACSHLGYLRAGEPTPETPELPGAPDAPPAEARGRRGHLGLRELRRSRMLVFILLIILATQVVSASLDLRLQGALDEFIPQRDAQTAYQGGLYATLNAVAGVLQFVVAPVVLRFVALEVTHLAIPLLHLVAIGVLLAHPSLRGVATAYIAFKAVDYSIFKAAKEILYIPLSFDARYRAKELIDVLGYRFGKGAVSTVYTAAHAVGAGLTGAYAPVAWAATAVWLGLAIPMVRAAKKERALPPSPLETKLGRGLSSGT